MARVSQAHLDARRRQILDGAARCFARNGFHATSMQDVLKEAGLSAGAVYRYFSSKEELIAAIAADTFGTIRAAFDSAVRESPPPMPDVVLGRVLAQVFTGGPVATAGVDRQGFPRMILQVWAETLRNEVLARTINEGYATLRGSWIRLVEGYQEAGLMRDDVPAEHVARTLIAAVQGFIAQQALFGGTGVEVLEDGLRGLMSMGGRDAGSADS